MSDSNDGSGGTPPASGSDASEGEGISGLRERKPQPSTSGDEGPNTRTGGAGEPATPKPATGLPAVPAGLTAGISGKGQLTTSVIPSTEPSGAYDASAAAALVESGQAATSESGQASVVSEITAEGRSSSAPPSTGVESEPPASASEAPASAPSVLQVLAPHLTEEQEADRRRDKLRGLVIIGVTFVSCIMLSVWGKQRAEPEMSRPPGPPTTVGVVGWPNKVDPTATLGLAREVSQREQLRGFVAEPVGPDGTVDFKKDESAMIRYSFQSAPGHGPQPPREPGTVPPRSYCGKQNVFIRRHGLVADPDVAAFPCSAKPREELPEPTCTAKQIWDHMISVKKVPKRRPARIEYFQARGGPAYRFTIPGTRHRVVLAEDCKTELKSPDSLGGVP